MSVARTLPHITDAFGNHGHEVGMVDDFDVFGKVGVDDFGVSGVHGICHVIDCVVG